MQTQIRLLLQEQSDLGLYYLYMPFYQKLCCIKWQTVYTQIRLLLQEQSDLGLYYLYMPFYQKLWCTKFYDMFRGSVGCAVRLETRRSRRGRQHSFEEIDHEIFSMVILSLPLIQEGQLSVSGERMCTILVNRLED